MKKLFTIPILLEDSGKTIGDYLKINLHLSPAQIRSLKFRENGICVNGTRVRVTYILQSGDVLTVDLGDEQNTSEHLMPADHPLSIFYEDEDIICVWKSAGVVVHPAHGHYQDSIANYLHAYFKKKQEEVQVRLIGRLDRDTSGILVFAKNKIAAARLWEQRSRGIFRKEYLALCEGTFPQEAYVKEQMVEEPIGKLPAEKNKMFVTSEGKPAVTYFQVLQPDEEETHMAARLFETSIDEIKENTLVRLHLGTGRTHQIRVHMAYLGHSLVGDAVYGNGISGQTNAKLCAWRVELVQPFTGEGITIDSHTFL